MEELFQWIILYIQVNILVIPNSNNSLYLIMCVIIVQHLLELRVCPLSLQFTS